MKTSQWPNLLSAARLGLMPAALVAAIQGSRLWFVALLVTALLTDALDGYLARRLHAESDFGRKLDSAADYLLLLTGIAGIALLWPETMRRELPWVIAGLAGFFAVVIYGFAVLGRAPCYHTWAAKVLAVALALTLVPLLAGWTPLPFRIVQSLQVAGSVEELAIAMLIPWYEGQVPTIWHAWRLRQARKAAGKKPAA